MSSYTSWLLFTVRIKFSTRSCTGATINAISFQRIRTTTKCISSVASSCCCSRYNETRLSLGWPLVWIYSFSPLIWTGRTYKYKTQKLWFRGKLLYKLLIHWNCTGKNSKCGHNSDYWQIRIQFLCCYCIFFFNPFKDAFAQSEKIETSGNLGAKKKVHGYFLLMHWEVVVSSLCCVLKMFTNLLFCYVNAVMPLRQAVLSIICNHIKISSTSGWKYLIS